MNIVDQFTQALQSQVWLAYLLAFAGGLLDCLTPCSGFATPVAVSYFSIMDDKVGRGRIALLLVVFALTVSASYALMGLLAAAIGGAVFAWLGTSPWPYLSVGLLLLYLAAVSAEMVPLWATPSFLRGTRLRTYKAREGTLAGAAAVGFGVSLMMGPCAAPILTTILYVVASKQDLLFGVTLLLAFSLGISAFMVAISLTGRQAFVYIGRIGPIRTHVKRAVNILVGLIALGLMAVGIGKATSGGAEPVAPAGQPVTLDWYSPGPLDPARALPTGGLMAGVPFPPLALVRPDGGRATFPGLAPGKWTFVTFWGTWCAACVAEIPDIQKMRADPAVAGRLAVFTIDYMDDREKALAYLRERGIDYPVLIDPDGGVTGHLGVVSSPYNLLVDPDGVVRWASGEFPHDYVRLIATP